MDIILVRHGNNPSSSEADLDPDLNETGIRQARLLGERLSKLEVDRIYASTLLRARHTAQIIGELTHVPVEVREELREINMGLRRMASWEEIDRDLPGYHAEWRRHETDLPYPGGENGANVRDRALPVIEEIAASAAQRAVVVIHGGVIRSLLCAFLGLGQEKRFLFGDPLYNCSMTEVRWHPRKGRFTVHTFNDIAHLGDEHTS